MTDPAPLPSESRSEQTPAPAGRRSSWLMIACCVPMLAIAIALVAAKVVSPGFLLVAVVCVVAMAVMMRGMNHGGGHP